MAVAQVSPQDVHARMQETRELVLLDCRGPDEIEIAAVTGTLNIPMNDIEQRMGELDKAAEIVVMCHHGVRSLAVANFLAEHGFTSVASMSGGIHAWSQTVDGDVPTY